MSEAKVPLWTMWHLTVASAENTGVKMVLNNSRCFAARPHRQRTGWECVRLGWSKSPQTSDTNASHASCSREPFVGEETAPGVKLTSPSMCAALLRLKTVSRELPLLAAANCHQINLFGSLPDPVSACVTVNQSCAGSVSAVTSADRGWEKQH